VVETPPPRGVRDHARLECVKVKPSTCASWESSSPITLNAPGRAFELAKIRHWISNWAPSKLMERLSSGMRSPRLTRKL